MKRNEALRYPGDDLEEAIAPVNIHFCRVKQV